MGDEGWGRTLSLGGERGYSSVCGPGESLFDFWTLTSTSVVANRYQQYDAILYILQMIINCVLGSPYLYKTLYFSETYRKEITKELQVSRRISNQAGSFF